MRIYKIVAMSTPIVYTLDGGYDPDGMLFAPRAHRPLIEWARDRWLDHDQLLPRLHWRKQRVELLLDAMARLTDMLDRLHHGTTANRDLLMELLRRETFDEAVESNEHRPGDDGTAHDRAVRQNVQATLREIRVALADLGDLAFSGPLGDGRKLTGSDVIRSLVWRSSEQGAAWRAHWLLQRDMLTESIAAWFAELEADPSRSLQGCLDRLVHDSGMPADRVKRLLLNDHSVDVSALGIAAPGYDRFNPMRPVPVIQPMVLRARAGEPFRIEVENSLSGRRVGFHVQGSALSASSGAGVRHADGCAAGDNPDTTIAPGATKAFIHEATHEGVWPINDLADVRGSQAGTNAHGLFGALVVEPAEARWRDPVSGEDLTDTGYGVAPDLDIIRPGEPVGTDDHRDFVDFHCDDVVRSFREFTVFLHDEPEFHSALHVGGEHSLMPINYRAEPMPERLPHVMRRLVERTPAEPPPGQVGVDRNAFASRLGPELEEQFWTARTPTGEFLERVAGEEQHHSSWLFGDPVTPIQRAYAGDPCRVRLVHAGVKETHVYHLHVHQWRAIASDTARPGVHGVDADGVARPKGSQILDAMTISPQVGMTIDPLYGSGSRQHAVGDIIWHCHLYPHFHHGMWGLWRSFDRLVDGSKALPNGAPCPALVPLPGREPLAPQADQPGFPWFIDGSYPMKSPPPPALSAPTRSGRRRLLQMPAHSPSEYAAMAPGCRDGRSPGATFVDLDSQAALWNRAAGLPAPRVVSYDVEVVATPVTYNADGWHDPIGHTYRLLSAEIREQGDDGEYHLTRSESFTYGPGWNPQPFYPRANHGDIVELRLHNLLTDYPADAFDHGQAPVECGLHVHLVKFDPLAADGSATGWNYISGASCRQAVASDLPGELAGNISVHRWVVDEEFGPSFFHDHLLANYRQKHGLFAALIAEPFGSQWWQVQDQDRVAWSDPQAVIVPPPGAGVPPYRDACLGVADFVPLLDAEGRSINPPSVLSDATDPGSMAVNYRSSPLTHRGDDPSLWFSNQARSQAGLDAGPGDPDTPLIHAYPGELVRIRLLQGSHEEQHSFQAHGMRWRHDWGNPRSHLVNQQSLGLSEAFTIEVGAEHNPLAPGDYLWQFAAIDDLWTGCWGFTRVLDPSPSAFAAFSPLPEEDANPVETLRRMRAVAATPPRPRPRSDGSYGPEVRTYVIVARRQEQLFEGVNQTDPWGLRFDVLDLDLNTPDAASVAEYRQARRTGRWLVQAPLLPRDHGPLVLRARRGEWIRVVLINDLLSPDDDRGGQPVPRNQDVELPRFGPEPWAPRLPLEKLDDRGHPAERVVSDRVSLHANLLRYDVRAADGAYVGRNIDGTVGSLGGGQGHGAGGHGGDHEGGAVVFRDGAHHGGSNWTTYWWYADDQLAPASHEEGPGTVCYLHDMADVRNHRHHGLVGALVVLPGDVTPYRPRLGRCSPTDPKGWVGARADLRDSRGTVVAQDAVLFLRDGLRLFAGGNPSQPIPDMLDADDPEDAGQKAISAHIASIRAGRPPRGKQAGEPLFMARRTIPFWLRVVCAGDKPRQHSLTLHGADWVAARHVERGPQTSTCSGIAPGWSHSLVVDLPDAGDRVIRSGAFRWSTEHGMWALLRVR